MSEWHGYPQHPDAHPERPWWRGVYRDSEFLGRVFVGWQRNDGKGCRKTCMEDEAPGAMDDRIAAADTEHPLPAPPPKCGQVWVWKWNSQAMVVAVSDAAARPDVYWSPGVDMDRLAAEWPPAGAVLVAGPHAPWAPEVE